MKKNLDELEKTLNYFFRDLALLNHALTHRSHGLTNNERLEFLGDSVLNLIMTVHLYNKKKYFNEGHLHRLRSKLVCEDTLFQIAENISLYKYVNVGAGEIKNGGNKKKSILADSLEALIGAIYNDSSFEQTNDVIDLMYEPIFKSMDLNLPCKDPKSELQEILQKKGLHIPKYDVTSKSGADHDQTFEVKCYIPDLNIITIGNGNSRKTAEVTAARKIIDLVKHKLK